MDSEPSGLRIRRSITELQDEYNSGNKKPLEDLMRAWKGIKELPPDDPRSFFTLGGYHGEPFRGAGWGNGAYWGGYCNHGNVLFPTWHRVYCLKLENALRSIPGCENVTLPFWDETSEDSQSKGIPSALTDETFVLDGRTIPNPLRSFVFNKNVVDHISGDNPDYSKPKGYETVRYPLSGLVGTAEDRARTAAHNAQFPNYATNVELLDRNVVNWLTKKVIVDGKPLKMLNVLTQYETCLDAPNYTVFSNTTSMAEWNSNVPAGTMPVVALESPHNSIHLAVGGFDVPGASYSPIPGANGDMGENDTAGLDPIFFFHHCFVDRVFWLWQQKHGFTDTLEIIPEYPGTNSVDSQGPTPGVAPNSWLTLDSPLDPFKLSEGGQERPYTSRDCINIEKQLGYTYGPGSLDGASLTALTVAPGHSNKVVHISGINRGTIRGSFVISAIATIDGKRHHLGAEAVLSRWHVEGCANCQTHLEAKAFIPMHGLSAAMADTAKIDVEVHTRDGMLGVIRPAALQGGAAPPRMPFRFEVR